MYRIKTMTTRDTVRRAYQRRQYGDYGEVSLSTVAEENEQANLPNENLENFHKLIPSVDHRAQVLHHAATFGVIHVFLLRFEPNGPVVCSSCNSFAKYLFLASQDATTYC